MPIVHDPPSAMQIIATRSNQDPPDHIEVLDFQRSHDRSAVKAVCRVRCGPIVINDVKVIAPVLSSRAFVAMPTRKFDDGWRPLVQFISPTLEQRISDAVLAEWRGVRA